MGEKGRNWYHLQLQCWSYGPNTEKKDEEKRIKLGLNPGEGKRRGIQEDL